MKQLHLPALKAYLRGDLKQLPRLPTRRPVSAEQQYIPSTNEYGEDNAAKALHIYVVTYFGGDYDRALDFIIGLMTYRNDNATA